ncbi:hypothetical protein L202_03906 [Cryptococcus amylolentus CBS 6039]|uniref:EF-hand domain-containing protein n=2 Tax=Cryptococcus amylolentus TaxID=104669 RepID=A0A1E3HUM7_9TREE|nr:hypothetical protein L202_03906 [Cryptococcus amylolentus CBS 6039]ODN80047.1 hypothetical protein L202_03906 [Cryptococcus amylolentus CBS 6039]ODO08275.1 hypothetical protein I350_03865 [Cryptococcus amylolentus CBS 6273]
MPMMPNMTAPSPYGSVSDEARRRYEERYAKKRAEEAAKARAEAEAANTPPPQPQQPPPQAQVQQGYAQQQYKQQPLQGYGAPPPQQQYQQSHPPPSQQYQQQPAQNHQQRPVQGGYQSPPQQQQQQAYQSRAPVQQQQQWNGAPQGQGLGVGSQQQGGYQQQQARAPPVAPAGGEDAELRSLFAQFDSSRSGQLHAFDLQRLLAKDATMEAREDAVKMLMNIFDTDRSGSINFMEFEGLYRYIQDWHGIFRRFDRDNSGLIDRKELHAALLGFGFSLPPELVAKLEKRFAPPPAPGQTYQPGISFDRFLLACVTVKHYTEAFRRHDPGNTGKITVTYNDYMDIVLESPS